ncbi:hypothetical protein H4R33_001286 [Dimargaris cristalligena]|nr:hypothetical protein H4R33_001286 [Dimargaris cristalligena]
MTSVATITSPPSTTHVDLANPAKPTTTHVGPVTSSGSTVGGEESEHHTADGVQQVTGRQSFTKEGKLRLRKWSSVMGRRMSLSNSRSTIPKVAPSPEPTNNSSTRLSISDRTKPSSPFSPPPKPFRSFFLCCGGFFPFAKPPRHRDYERAATSMDDQAVNPAAGSTKPGQPGAVGPTESNPSLGLSTSNESHPMLPPISSSSPLLQDIITSVSVEDGLDDKSPIASVHPDHGIIPISVSELEPYAIPETSAPARADVESAKDHANEEDHSEDDDDDDDDISSDEEAALQANPQLNEIVMATAQVTPPLLQPLLPQDMGKKCLVLDLDETLLHSSFRMVENPDYIVPVKLEGQTHNVYVLKRPGVDEFMKKVGEHFEVVVFTASLSKYADPVLDLLDIHKVVRHRLFRESCILYAGNYVKDLSRIGRPLGDLIIVDNSPASYAFHPNNAIPITTWFNDTHDTELLDLVPFLLDLKDVPDVSTVLDNTNPTA